jgi:hypothetical protein
MTKDEALRLALEALEKLWNIIDDIDTYSDMAKADEKLYRSLVERRQRQRFEETGISTDGYELHGGAITAIKAALEAKDEPVKVAHRHEWFRTGEMKVGQMRCISCGTWAEEEMPKRTWVGLTDEDIEQEFGFIDELLRDCVQRTEAKLKEKNT